MANSTPSSNLKSASVNQTANPPKSQSSADLITGPDLREYMLLVGKDGVGKTCAVVSLAWWIERINPDAQFFIIDTENKFRAAMRGFGPDAPQNIIYYKTDDMNQVTWTIDQIMAKHRPGDWLAVESMSRVWERAQDMGYRAVSGQGKVEYLERRAKAHNVVPATPKPDELWSVTKGAHDGAFMDRISQCEDLNVILTSTVSRPPKEGAFMKENADRKAARVEMGIDAGIDGAPRLPYYVETLAILELKNGAVSCRVLRDNLSTKDESRVEFDVEGRRTWATDFWTNCRG